MKEKQIRISLPKSWNDLSEKQLEQLALLFHSTMEVTAFDLAVFHILMGVSGSNARAALNARAILKEVALSELKKHYAFIYEACNRTIFPKFIKVNDTTLYGPMVDMINLSVSEFATAEGFIMLWDKNKDREALENLAAVLYCPEPFVRPVFNKLNLPEKAPLFADIPIETLLAIYLAYSGCKAEIVKRFKEAFPKSTKIRAGKKYGFGKVILRMAGGKFGTHEETSHTNLYTFLEEFQDNLAAAAEAKRNLPKS